MNKTTMTAIALLASTASAFATDLPSKKTPVPPTRPVSVESFDTTPTFVKYVGINGGIDTRDSKTYSGGLVAGVNTKYVGAEVSYTYLYPEDKILGKRNDRSVAAFNVTPQYTIPGTPVTPYGVLGTGYSFGAANQADHAVYNYGAGLRYAFSQNIDLDGRFVRTEAYDKKFKGTDDRFTLGVNYKF